MKKPVSFTMTEAAREALTRVAARIGKNKSQTIEFLIHLADNPAGEGAE